MRRWIPLSLIFLALACGDDGPVRPPESPDPPVLLAVTLEPDSVLTDTVRVAVDAARADNVFLRVNGALVAADTVAPFLLAWNSREAVNGTHELTIRAANVSGAADTTLSRLVVNLGRGALVFIDPPDTMLASGTSLRFTARVLGEADTSVTWNAEVTGDVPIEAGPGTVDATGLYTAPALVPEGAEVRVTATSVADPSAGAAARVTFDQPLRLVILSAPPAVRPGIRYPLRARLYGTRYDRVRWSVREGPSHGSVGMDSLYLAPPVMPDPPRVTLVARSVFYPLLPDTSVTIPFDDPARIEFLSVPSTVMIGETYPIAAEVVGIEDSRVVLGIDEGPAHGTLDESGLYTAPPTRPLPSQVTFRATSVVDPMVTAARTVLIDSPVEIGIVKSPDWLLLNGRFQLRAMVTGTPDTRIRWSVDGGAAFGHIDQNGLYTAPSVPPDPPRATVRATSLADTLKRATATVPLYGPVRVEIDPDAVALSLGDHRRFTATVADAPSSEVTWSLGGGPERGFIEQDGVYSAPQSLPDPPFAEIHAQSVVDPSARDTATVRLSVLPPPAELDRMRAAYHGAYEVTELAEQVTGIVATALSFARYLSGDDEAARGSLVQQDSGWSFTSEEGDHLNVFPRSGPYMLIMFRTVEGELPYQDSGFRYLRGVEFKGELDCTIQVGPRSPLLRLTNSSRSRWDTAKPACPCSEEAAFTRTLEGRIRDADGGSWDLDVRLEGEMWDCPDPTSSYHGVVQSISGTFTTPEGLAVAAAESFSSRTTTRSLATITSRREGFDGGFTVTDPFNLYRWEDLSFFWSWDESGPEEPESWYATGTVSKNNRPIGTVRFDRPVSPDMTGYPRPLVDFGPDAVLFLDEYRFDFHDPTGPVLSPFRENN